ncbi:MAG: hypothetical protein QOF61_1597 [Acidobacteriota bacterium]|jgi:hypothetical protein|nr:hypothetical protein [Acidobacteriota bacterium]
MKNRISFVLFVSLLATAQARVGVSVYAQGATPPSVAQTKPQEPAKSERRGASPPTRENKIGAQEAEREAASRRKQAVEILKGVVERAGEVENVEARASVTADALDLLWKHDETYARANFLKAFDALVSPSSSGAEGEKSRVEVKAAVNLLLKALAKHDPPSAAKLMERYRQLAESASKEDDDARVSQRDRLALARSSLDLDPAQSGALASKVIESGLPSSLPEYLYDLERHDKTVAESLYREAITALARGAYNTTQATILSTSVFRERQPLYPIVPAGSEGNGSTVFGMMLVNISVAPPGEEVNQSLARAYLGAAGIFLNAQAVALEQSGESLDAGQVGYCYFLVKKLRAYADRLSLNGDHAWDALDAKFEILARRAKLSDDALGGLVMFAQRIATENNAIEFSDGSTDFANAEKTQDPTRKTELLASGIYELIGTGRFAEAEQKIADIKDGKIRERLSDYLHFREADAAIKKPDWDAARDQINRVGDEQLRSYLLLEAARVSLGGKRKDVSLEHLRALMSTIPKIDDPDERAMTLVAAAGTLYAVDPQWGAQVLIDGVKAINNATAYRGSGYGVMIDSPKYKLWFPLADSDLSHCFEQAAKLDWANTVVAAQGINSKEVRAKAYVAACRAVL